MMSQRDERLLPLMVIFGAVGDLANRLLVPALVQSGGGRPPSRALRRGRHRARKDHHRNLPRADAPGHPSKQPGQPRRRANSQRARPQLPLLEPETRLARRYTRRSGSFSPETAEAEGTRGAMIFYLATASGAFRRDPAQSVALRPASRESAEPSEESYSRNPSAAICTPPALSIWRFPDPATKSRSTASTITWAKRPFRNHGLPLLERRYLNLSGIADYIDHIQITVAETVGVEKRGMYYDKAGTLRDMVPNHIFQLISLTAMEPPDSFDADVVRDEQAKILKALTPMTDEEVLMRTVRGQYGEGRSGAPRSLRIAASPWWRPIHARRLSWR